MFGGDGRVFDVAAIEDALTGKTVYSGALIAAAHERGHVIVFPAAALAEAAARVDNARGYRAHALDVVLGLVPVVVDSLDAPSARAAADLLAAAAPGGRPVDLAAAHVALVARRRGWKVTTDRGSVLHAIDAAIAIDPLP